MKKKTFINLLLLFALVAGALWFNLEDVPERGDGPSATPSDYILALSWQPAFCERKPNVPECRSQRAGRFDVDNFSLHGLWPQSTGNRYCGVSENHIRIDKSGRWRDLPKLQLDEPLRQQLARKMPGYRSGLHRHEWYKHGTCAGGISPQTYFEISLALLDQLNNSAFKRLLSDNPGARLSIREIKSAFDRAFGKGAGKRIIVDCYRDNGRRIIEEIKLSISGNLTKNRDLRKLLAAGETVGKSCPSGIVDKVGLQ